MICLKKMPALVDKASVIRVCVDDFAFRKRYSYGTVMVDLDTHRIIDIIDSREASKVEEWLKSYPCLEIISRDGAQTYSSAVKNLIQMRYRLAIGSICSKIYLMQLKNICIVCFRQGS